MATAVTDAWFGQCKFLNRYTADTPWFVIEDCLSEIGQVEIANLLQRPIEKCVASRDKEAWEAAKQSRPMDIGPVGNPCKQCDTEFIEILSREVITMCRQQATGDIAKDEVLTRSWRDFTAIGLIYGPNGSMVAHRDSCTTDRDNHWNVAFTLGMDCHFTLNGQSHVLKSGTALFANMMTVVHGVTGFGGECPKFLKPFGLENKRLGIIAWEPDPYSLKKYRKTLALESGDSSEDSADDSDVESDVNELCDLFGEASEDESDDES